MEPGIPERLIFSCEADAFLIYDAQAFRGLLHHGSEEPWLSLRCGPGNVFEARPQRVVAQNGKRISVACADGAVIHLDLEEDTAERESANVSYRYRGDLQEGNDGLGYMRAR